MTMRFTGWHMAAILLGFFGLVVAVNLYMAHTAISTFGGTVVENSYVTVRDAIVRAGESEIRAEGAFSLGYPRSDGGEEIAATVEDIRQFQRRLRALAIYAGPADGIFNDLTRIAIREFERAHGLPQTGLPTAANARRLLGEPPLPEHGATQEGVGAAD